MATVEERLAVLERLVFGGSAQSVKSLDAGPITSTGVLLDSGYRAAADVRKSTNVGAEAPGPGGSAGLYVQHLAQGAATDSVVTTAIRGALQTTQTRKGPVVNDACGMYMTIRNAGQECGAFGVHVDANHAARGASSTYGLSAELFRETPAGATVGVHVRSMAQADLVNDVGVLVSRGGSISGFVDAPVKRAFAAGSDEITGELRCDYGLDLHAATCDVAAIRLRSGTEVQWDTGGEIATRFDPATGFLQFCLAGKPTLEIQMATGEIRILGKTVRLA